MATISERLSKAGLATRDQAAERLGVDGKTVLDYVRTGRLDGMLGVVALVDAAALEQYATERSGRIGRPAAKGTKAKSK